MIEAATASSANSSSERAMIADRLLDAAGISVDRLPMLPVVFDRMARLMADAMRQKSPSPSYISVSYVENNRIGDVLDEFESNALVAVLYSPEWDARVLVGFDRDFIFTLVDVLFGADGTEPPIDDERLKPKIATDTLVKKASVSAGVVRPASSLKPPSSIRIEAPPPPPLPKQTAKPPPKAPENETPDERIARKTREALEQAFAAQ